MESYRIYARRVKNKVKENMESQLLNFCASLNADSVAGKSTKARFDAGEFTGIVKDSAPSDKAVLLHKLAYADSRGKKTASGKQAPSELQGLEQCASPSEILSGLKSLATDKRYWREIKAPALTHGLDRKPGHINIDLVMYPPAQDTVAGLSDSLTGALKGLSSSDRAQMLKEIVRMENPDTVAGMEDDDSVADLIEGIRRQERRQGRIEAKGERQGARADNREQRRANAKSAKSEGTQYDDGEFFLAQDGKIYKRTQQRRMLPVVTSTSTAGGQNSLANAAAVTLTGAPTMELEIIKLRIVVEGSATNVEIQETLVASFSVTSLKIGSIELIVGTGGTEFPMGESVDPTFWSCLVVVGGNSNLTVTVLNGGATQVFTVSAYARVVVPD